MVVTFLTFLSVAWSSLNHCIQNVMQTSDMCLLLNGAAFISATQTENAWYSIKHKE